MSEWIKSKDRLPECDKIIGFYYHKIFHIGYYTDTFVWQSYIDGYNCVFDVEFWFELPEVKDLDK